MKTIENSISKVVKYWLYAFLMLPALLIVNGAVEELLKIIGY